MPNAETNKYKFITDNQLIKAFELSGFMKYKIAAKNRVVKQIIVPPINKLFLPYFYDSLPPKNAVINCNNPHNYNFKCFKFTI